MQVRSASIGMRREPDPNARLDNELLFGEVVTTTDKDHAMHNGLLWFYVKTKLDGYQGWVPALGLSREVQGATHRVCVPRTPGLRFPEAEAPTDLRLSMNAVGTVTKEDGIFSLFGGVYVRTAHLMSLSQTDTDYVAVAKKLVGTPYEWGAKNIYHGVDCSALVQHAFQATGVVVPRNSGDQANTIGEDIADGLLSVRRGDLVFWPGHVALVSQGEGARAHIIHATHDRGEVFEESLQDVIERRVARGKEPPTRFKRP